MDKKKNIVRVSKNSNPFVMIDHRPLNDDNLSWQAKGMLAYLLSKPDDWKVIIRDLENRSTNGRASVQSILKELQEKGYMERIQHKDLETGRFTHVETIVYELPQERLLLAGGEVTKDQLEPESRKPANGKPANGEPANGKSHTTNKYITNNESTNNDQVYKNSASEVFPVDNFELAATKEEDQVQNLFDDSYESPSLSNKTIHNGLDKDKKNNKNQEAYTDDFEAFWREYPNKRDKRVAFNKYKKELKDNKNLHPYDLLMAARLYALELKQLDTYSKYAKTWLAQKSYLEYVPGTSESEDLKAEKFDPYYLPADDFLKHLGLEENNEEKEEEVIISGG